MMGSVEEIVRSIAFETVLSIYLGWQMDYNLDELKEIAITIKLTGVTTKSFPLLCKVA